ncbi:MAG: exodeoxyribonuclease VII small subunit [Gammaproteobacteria bacterium]
MARKTTSKTIDFEKSLKQLETLVDKLEKGDLSLEDSLKNFENGVKLTRECRQALQKAEQKISVLSKEDNNWIEKDLDNDAATEG